MKDKDPTPMQTEEKLRIVHTREEVNEAGQEEHEFLFPDCHEGVKWMQANIWKSRNRQLIMKYSSVIDGDKI